MIAKVENAMNRNISCHRGVPSLVFSRSITNFQQQLHFVVPHMPNIETTLSTFINNSKIQVDGAQETECHELTFLILITP